MNNKEKTKLINFKRMKFTIIINENGQIGYRNENELNGTFGSFYGNKTPKANSIEQAERILRSRLEIEFAMIS